MMRRALWVACLVACLPAAAAAEDPCKGVEYKQGKVITGLVLAVATVDKPQQVACVDQLGKQLTARKHLTAVTVTVRVPDKQRLDGSALAAGKKVGAALQAAGVPAVRVSVVVPRAEADEPSIIQVLYVDRALRPVARVDAVHGNATWAEEGGAQQPAKVGDTMEPGAIFRMKGADSLKLALADGSVVMLEPDAILRLAVLEANTEKVRKAELELIQGGLTVNVKPQPTGSTFKVVAGESSATVDGALIRLRRKEGVLVVEAAKGTAVVGGKTGSQPLAEGQATRALADGTVEAARALLPAPRVTAPLQGEITKDTTLNFSAVEGATVYRLEFAEDAAFLKNPFVVTDKTTSARVPAKAKKGKYFWRVFPVDKDGLWGQASRIHAFTR